MVGRLRAGKNIWKAIRRKKWLPRNSFDSGDFPMQPWENPHDLDQLIRALQPCTLLDPLRLSMLYGLACESKMVKGDIVECGVYNGGSAAILARAILDCQDRKLWLYDTFKGLPSPDLPKDGSLAEEYAGEFQGSIDMVAQVLRRTGFPLERTILRKGAFRDTFKEPLPKAVALLHIDADWHKSVLGALQTFYPLIQEGGIIILDDFGHWEGAREAFYDFCAERDVKPLIERAGYTHAFWRKGQIHNRDTRDRYITGTYKPFLEDGRK